MELSKEEPKENPRNLWKPFNEDYRVKAVRHNHFKTIEFYCLNNNDFLFIHFKRPALQFLLFIQLPI